MENILNFIDGKWIEALNGEFFDVYNPADGKVIAKAAKGNRDDAKLAIKAAKREFYENKNGWRRFSAVKRSEILLSIANELEKQKEDFAKAETIDNGKPYREAIGDVEDAVSYIKYYAGAVRMPSGVTYEVSDGFGQMHSYTIKEPVGVCALITPWNYPLLMGVQKIAPALAAGNTVVFKSSSETPLSTAKFFKLLDREDIPKGTVNLVMGSGSTVGNEFSENTDVDMVSFTGSTSVGQTIYRKSAENIKKIGLELGGKSPNIIFADADLDGAVEWAMMGVFFNQGEVCSAGSRIIIEESIKDEFVKRLAKRADKMTLGNGLNNPDMGPLISEGHMNKVLGYIEKAKEEGGKIVCGGYRYTEGECANGYFVRPTIIDNVKKDNTAVLNEIFGPVVTIQTFKTEEEAVEMANDTEFGLAGAVFTKDGARALRVVKEIRAGIMWINCYNPAFVEAPWGGYKKSGTGRELSKEGLDEYTETKQITINLTPGELGWYEKR